MKSILWGLVSLSLLLGIARQANSTSPGLGALGYWSFDDTTATDNSGNGNNGTLINGPSVVAGKSGQALSFNGASQYVDFGDVLDPGIGDLSVFAWVNTTQSGSLNMIVSKRNSSSSTNSGYQLFQNGSGGVSFTFGDGNSSRVRVDSSGPQINDGNWHLVGVVFNRGGSGVLYVDGVPATNGSGSITSQTGAVNNSVALRIGVEDQTGNPNLYWAGAIDEVGIYNRALTAQEIADIYNPPIGPPPPLTIVTTTLPAGTTNVAYSQTLAASGGVPPYTWSVVSRSLPQGLTLSTGGTISGTPTAAGTANFTAQVRDSTQVTATQAFNLTINPVVSTPTISVVSTPTISLGYDGKLRDRVGQSELAAGADGQLDGVFTVTLNAGSGNRTVIFMRLDRAGPVGIWDTQVGNGFWTLGAASGLDTALLNAANDSVNFAVAEGSSFKIFAADFQNQMFVVGSGFTLIVNFADGSTATGNLTVGAAQPLSVATNALANGTLNVSYGPQSLAATGGISPYTWSVIGGSLPNGLTLSQDGNITGTPTALGAASFLVQVRDNAAVTATKSFNLTINSASLGVVTSTLPNGTSGAAYNQSLAASGGVPPYAWSLASGTLPQGLMLSQSGTISGIPTGTGTSFTVRVQDSTLTAATQSLSLTINLQPLTIVSTSLPNGTINTAYIQTLAASGGVPPYTWSVVSGSLSQGLTLSQSGTISGIPTGTGTSFTVRVQDSTLTAATQLLSLNVNTVSYAQTGVDINSSSEVTATHLSSALPVNQGGTGTTSPLTGFIRGSTSVMTATELSGDATTSGSNVVTVARVNGNTPGGSCTNQVVTSLDSSARPTCSNVTGSQMTNNTVTSSQMAVVNTRRNCIIENDTQSATALTDAQITGRCDVPAAATLAEIAVYASGGIPSVTLEKWTPNGGATADLQSGGALATGSGGAYACATSASTCISGVAKSGTVSLANTSLTAGDVIRVKSATAGGTATWHHIVATYTIN